MKLMVHLEEAGWGSVLVDDGAQQLRMEMSYIGDAISEMAEAAVALLRGDRSARFAFQDEPGEHVFVLTRGDADQLQVEVYRNKKNFSHKLEQRVIEIECTVLDFVGQVFANLDSFTMEEKGSYEKRWRHEFPTALYEFLRNSF